MNDIKPPSEHIAEELKKRGWTQEDLASVLGRSKSRVNEIVLGKQSISVEVASDLASAFGTTAQVWLDRESTYRLSTAKLDDSVRKRARLFEKAPVKEMIRRGWIRDNESLDVVEQDVLRFYDIPDLDTTPAVHGAMRKTAPTIAASPAQVAWAFRVRQLASVIPARSLAKYDKAKLTDCQRDLKKLVPYSGEVKKIPPLLMKYGIRYVVVEGLPGAKMDGFATWLDENSPVIGMSLKRDKLDSFWFTLWHEIIHVKYEDVAPIDGQVGELDDPLEVKPMIERRADKEAAEMLVPPDELESFIKRVGPFYSTAKINQLANRIKVHPNIIVGQLKYRGCIPQTHHNKEIMAVREIVTKSALADGWGKKIDVGSH